MGNTVTNLIAKERRPGLAMDGYPSKGPNVAQGGPFPGDQQ